MKRSDYLRCDVCGKPQPSLGGYGPGCEGWWVCLKCFGKADAIAEKQDRWPNASDFQALKSR